MADGTATLDVHLGLDSGADARELDDLTAGLRRELLELDVDAVDRPEGGPAPEGARAVEVAALGALLVTLAKTPAVLGAVVNTVRAWLSRGQGRKVKITLGDDELEITGVSSEQQERLIGDWIARHAEG